MRAWPFSGLCRGGTVLLNLPSAIARWGYRMCTPLFDGSLFCGMLCRIGSTAGVMVGLLMIAMLSTPHDNWNNVYGFLGILVVAGLFLVGQANQRKYALTLTETGPYLGLYVLWICYGLITSSSIDLSVRFFLFHMTGVLLILVVVSGIKNYQQLQIMIILAVIGVTISALYGCYQGIIEGVEVLVYQQDVTLNEGMPGRAYAFFDNPNNFAQMLAMLIPLNVALVFTLKNWRGKLLALLALIPCVVAIGLTYSRSGWIGLAIALVIFVIFLDWRVVPVLLVAGVLSLPFLPETIYNRILTIGDMSDSSVQYRISIYYSAGSLLSDFWGTGVGLGSDVMSEIFVNGDYRTIYDGSYPVHSHNNYLQMWLEVGLLGAITYIALLFSQLKRGVQTFRRSTNRSLRLMLAAAISSFCGIMIIGLVEYTWFYPRNMITYFFLFAIIASCVSLGKQEMTRQGAAS